MGRNARVASLAGIAVALLGSGAAPRLVAGVARAQAIEVAPPRLRQAAGEAAAVRVTGVARPEALRLWASVGELALERVRAGTLEARYRPPLAGPPRRALIAALDEEGIPVAVAAIALEARSEIPLLTEPHATVEIRVGDRSAEGAADGAGRARLGVWVGPGEGRATVRARDRAGNISQFEVPIDAPPLARLWLVEFARELPGGATSPGGARGILALSLDGPAPTVGAAGGEIVGRRGGPQATLAWVRGAGPITVSAESGGARVERVLDPVPVVAPVTAAGPSRARPPALAAEAGRVADVREELGASIGVRLSGTFAGGAASLEWRRRLGRLPLRLGIDAAVLVSGGSQGAFELIAGGIVARASLEARVRLHERAQLAFGLLVGGALVGERRAEAARATSVVDGGPSVGGALTLLARLGPGLLGISAGYAWTPLLGLGNAGLEGGLLSVGYRAAR